MPRRRPPREGPVVNNYNLILFAAAIFILPWLADAQQQQQRSAVQQRHESPHEGVEADVLHTLEATKIRPQIETPLTPDRRKKTLNNSNNRNRIIKNDASAIATLAPADSAVAAPPSRLSSLPSAGLSSPQSARSLEDWEVEDFVLLATVDGKLYARDRKTGRERWELSYERPMVETKHFRRNRSELEEDYVPMAIDDFIWIVEPNNDGSVYVYMPPGGPHEGLVNTGLTMKKIVEEMTPYENKGDPPVTYTGEKKTDLITVDAHTGKVIKYFGPEGALVDGEGNSCINRGFPSGECANPTLTIGRTEYTVAIQSNADGHKIAKLSFFEWSPNTFDRDLQRQYHTTLDKKYIYTSHDGGVMGLDHNRPGADDEPGRLFKHKFSSPVVRVFDVARPWNAEKENPELVILPQPMPPRDDRDSAAAHHRESSIFLNHTEDGSWYAMSGKSYPLAVQGSQQARIMKQGLQQQLSWDVNDLQQSDALVGLHSIDQKTEPLLTISPGDPNNKQLEDPSDDHSPALIGDLTIVQRLQKLPAMAAQNLKEFIKNPILIIFLAGFILTNQRQLRAWIGRMSGNKQLSSILEGPIVNDVPEVKQPSILPEEKTVEIPTLDGTVDNEPAKAEVAAPLETEVIDDREVPASIPEIPGTDAPTPTPKKKKAHRGTRGGVKHKKGKAVAKDDSSQDGNQAKASLTVEDAVRDAQNAGEQTKLEPDIQTVPSDPSEVSGPIIRMGALQVNTEKLIGTGSNGTMVFEGNFDGREVAVKRMLIQFFDIASQETKLLRESDDHPNGMFPFGHRKAYLLT